MSLYRGHLIGGVITYLLLMSALSLCAINFGNAYFNLIATLSGSLFPDIDIYSQGQKLFFKLLFLVLFLCLLLKQSILVMALLILSVLAIIVPHRGIFHSLSFISVLVFAVSSLFMYGMPQKMETILSLALFFLAGAISHLILDKGLRKTFFRKKSQK